MRFSVFMLAVILPSAVSAGFIEQRLAVIPSGYQLDRMNIVFAAEGSKVAFAVRSGEKTSVVFEDKIGKPYSHVRHISISPDGRSVAHNGTVIPSGGGESLEFRVVNGIETGPFQQVCNPVFSPDSRKVVFEAKYEDKWRHAISPVDSNRIVAETGKADLNWMQPVFSSDGRHIVSIQQQHHAGKNVRLVSSVPDLREVGRREYDLIVDVVYSIDRSRTAYRARKGGKELIVVSSFLGGDELEGAAYDSLSYPVLSEDGLHVAYSAGREGKRLIVIDGKEIPAPFLYERLKPVFSRDGRTYAYLAFRDGKEFVVAAGKESTPYDEVSAPALSPDGLAFAFGGLKDGKWRPVINGNEGPAFDSVDGVQFAPDGKHVIYRASKGDKRCMVIADLKGKSVREGPMFDEIWQPFFDAEGRLGYGALNGKEIWWKVLAAD